MIAFNAVSKPNLYDKRKSRPMNAAVIRSGHGGQNVGRRSMDQDNCMAKMPLVHQFLADEPAETMFISRKGRGIMYREEEHCQN
jgi:hypothetical protein